MKERFHRPEKSWPKPQDPPILRLDGSLSLLNEEQFRVYELAYGTENLDFEGEEILMSTEEIAE